MRPTSVGQGVRAAHVAAPRPVPADAAERADPIRSWTQPVMGTVVSVTMRGPGARSPRGEVAQAVADVFAGLADVESVFSLYRAHSPMARLRRGEVSTAQACATWPQLAEVLGYAASADQLTGGLFSTMLPVPAQGLPADLDDPAPGLRRLDLTGIVKGWAIARAAATLTQVSEHGYCINAGGDVAVGGSGAAGAQPWLVGIADPADPARVAHVLTLTRGAVATSGNAARGEHIIDPRTGQYVRGPGSVSVCGPSPMWADVWATALFVAAAGDPGLVGRVLLYQQCRDPGGGRRHVRIR